MSDELSRLVAKRYDSQPEVNKYIGREHLGLLPWEQVVESTFLRPSVRLLDIGCGAGREAIGLSLRGHKVTAVDINSDLIAAGRQAAVLASQNIDFQLADGQRIPFPSAYFDYSVIWSQVLGNVPGSARRSALLAEVNASLRDNGILSLSVHDRLIGEGIAREKGLIKDDVEYELEDGDYIERGDSPSATTCYWHYFQRDELVDLAEKAGFEVLECQPASSYGQVGWDVLHVLVARKRGQADHQNG